MPPLDAATLLMVIAVIDAVACVIWLALGEALRIAPRAARRIAAYHGLLALAWWPAIPESMERLVALPLDVISAGLLTAGVRALMRVRHDAWDIAAIVALGLLATAATAGDPDLATARAVSNLAGGVLAAMAAWDVAVGAGFRAGFTGALMLPYLVLAGGCFWRAGGLLGWTPPGLDLAGLGANAPLALLRLVVDLTIATGLIALVLQRLIARVRHLTRRDALTGLLNRRALEEHLARMQALVERGRANAVLVLDVDHFKRINDELGHAGGDAALQHLAGVLGATLRDTDCFGRLGGEEFAVLLPDTDLDGAMLVAERLRKLLQEQPLAWGDKLWPISASFGVATMQRGDANGHGALSRADAAMYAAKARGRNRVLRAAGEAEFA
ncbi:GGDEF domain-containing protein [Mitsuaria sp. GD03876]|uniref:GGDEF domain-containing protein n=1 Tax=Mitsuaria sp. GD03876 TaxID=2975399 RepID=UPI00244740BC|nr:GGDEF domain-containing protein [Mitsuaria sp. GD03876]MDH0862933.1 GGDEF domain-containing protein [Mitsuaria sp. GD03876]